MNKSQDCRIVRGPHGFSIATIAVFVLASAGCFERMYYHDEAAAPASESSETVETQEPVVESPPGEQAEAADTPAELPADSDSNEAFADQVEAELETDASSDVESAQDETLADDLFGSTPPEQETPDDQAEAPSVDPLPVEPPAAELPANVATTEKDEAQDEPSSPSFEALFGESSQEPAETSTPPPAATEAKTEPAKDETPNPDIKTPSAPNTRLDAWLLGSKLSLAVLAKQRAAPENTTARWLAESEQLATRLGLPRSLLEDALKTPGADNNSRVELNHLLVVGKDVGARVAALHDAEHAALFEAALKSNLFLVLYGPDEPLVPDISKAVAASAERGGLPANLWQAALAELSSQADFNEVKRMLYDFHQRVGLYLAERLAP